MSGALPHLLLRLRRRWMLVQLQAQHTELLAQQAMLEQQLQQDADYLQDVRQRLRTTAAQLAVVRRPLVAAPLPTQPHEAQP